MRYCTVSHSTACHSLPRVLLCSHSLFPPSHLQFHLVFVSLTLYFMGKFNLKVGIGEEELVFRYSHVRRDRVSVKVKSGAFFCINYSFYCHGYFVTLSFTNFTSCKQEKCL